ncbi:uncharacterized protein B0P05DRAFT_546041 [Gilbertella persicaria]|uniref:uncharacterized protein n=1 Tax=Gilbertella persicaria TaxID=101096 RepID=UPI0022210063|nr:uncharacterized protein B0P05DRAFT_546041 [Gilbertella persicaria]KAI8076485.1 hypothetical protein B0P05DRAFT_546041 [Gilbertella persicaria]
MNRIQGYFNKIKGNLGNENGKHISSLLSIDDTKHTKLLIDQSITLDDIESACARNFESPWTDIILNHIKTVLYVDQQDYVSAFDSQKEVVQGFQKILPNLTRWCLVALYTINNELRIIATQADLISPVEEGQRRKLEEAANVISKSFTACVTDRAVLQVSKKYGTYCMIGILFRIYFKLKQQNLCKNILRAVKAADLPPLDVFPKSDRVTFRYYLGRLYFLEEDYVKAEHELDLAFKECTRKKPKNKELILQTLLPVKLMRGIVPTTKLFDQFPRIRDLYRDVAESIQKGNVKAFNTALAASEPLLIRQGTYFAMEKAESIAIRQLFRKIYLIMGLNTRIPIGLFQRALAFEGMKIELEEVEWMLANMIYKGYMKGYLSHEKMFLVLSKDNPFPKV